MVRPMAVHYRLKQATGTLERGTAPVTSGGVAAGFSNYQPLCRDVASATFVFKPGSSKRTAVVTLDLTLSRDGESVNLFQEVHLDNAP